MSAAGKPQIRTDPDLDVAPTGRDSKVRTLKEPPDIWDLVHETRVEFKPGSAFFGHLTSLHPLALAAILLIIGGGAVFWFVTLRGGSESHIASPPAPAESNNTKGVLSPQSTTPNRTESASDQPSAPAESSDTRSASSQQSTVSNRTESASDQQFNSAPVGNDTAASTIDEPKIDVAAPAASSDRTAPAKPRRKNPTSSTKASGETVAGTRKDSARSSSLTAAGSATAPRPGNEDRGQASTTLDPKSDKEKSAPTAPKKETNKALSPQLIAPAKAAPTPKAKVIPWP